MLPLILPTPFKKQLRELKALTPQGDRLAEPEEIAEAILFLALDASQFITGQQLVLDGGLTEASVTW